MERKSGRYPPRYSPNTMLVSKDDGFSLRIPSGKVALLLTRWLLTKFYSQGKKYSEEEIAICYLLSEFWSSYRNKGFLMKNETELLKLRTLFRLSLNSGNLERHEKEQEKLVLSQNVLFNPRAFLSLPQDFAISFLKRINRRLKRHHPELRRIGVGYRDKGTARIPSIDGSPRWEELAVALQPRIEPLESKYWWEVTEFLIRKKPGLEGT